MWLIALGLAAVSAAVSAAAAEENSQAPAAIQKLLQNCDAHKFETIIDVPAADGQVKHSRMRLCGTEGQSDADWIGTLKDAVAKTEANLAMPKPVRDQIVTALNAEIDRLKTPTSAELTGVVPAPRNALPATTSQDYSALPPIPPPRSAAPAAPAPEYAALPPLPTAPPPPVHVLGGSVAASVPLLPRPRMTFTCYAPGEGADGPCTDFSRDTLITVRADEDLPTGTSVRFVRNGSAQADIDLAQLKRGKSMRFALPADVCNHVTNGKLELRIVRTTAAYSQGQEVGSEGPYDLRC